jgi:hypothetical protein
VGGEKLNIKLNSAHLKLELARMNKSCCFVLQYNTEALVLVLQYSFENEQYSSNTRKNLSEQSACTACVAIPERVTKKIEIRRVSKKV